jgi:LCP family protein required for cell wall assembly
VSEKHHRRTILRVILVAELVIAMVTAASVVFAYNHLDGNIEALPDIEHKVAKPQAKPEQPKTPLNILVMGSDTRDCDGCHIDAEAGEGGSDTTMLLHVSADRKTAYGVSLARDTMVNRPDCEVDGKTIPGENLVMFNEAFSVGGPLCTVQQVEDLTGIFIDHTVVVNFAGFEDMVDAVHGVEVCIPTDVNDPAHGIVLDAGTRLISGREALNYVRERHQLSLNSDIGRMKRQQAFVASMVNRVLSADTLAMPNRLYQFLDAATRSIQLDKDLASLGKLYDLVRELKDIDLRHITFVTVPIEPYPADINRLQFAPEATDLWKLIRDDAPLGMFRKGAISADDGVGNPDDQAQTDAERERQANGLCT